jgi:hypothetical protein
MPRQKKHDSMGFFSDPAHPMLIVPHTDAMHTGLYQGGSFFGS